jgi:hypothetical protein
VTIEISGCNNTIKHMCAGIKISGDHNYIGEGSLYLYLSGIRNFIEGFYNRGSYYYDNSGDSNVSLFPAKPVYLTDSTIGLSCSYITTPYTANNNIYIKNGCSDITFSKGYNRNIVIEPGCSSLTITSQDSTSGNNYIQNIHIHEGIQNKSISVGTNLSYQTDVYSTNHQTLTL